MRLDQEEARIIRKIVEEVLPGAEIYLFGSRADDSRLGGDIDLLILSEEEIGLTVEMKIGRLLQERLGEQKIDILCEKKGNLSAFARLARMEGVQL